MTPGFLERLREAICADRAIYGTEAAVKRSPAVFDSYLVCLLIDNATKLEALIEAAKEYEAAWHAGMVGLVHNFTEAEVRPKMARRDVAFMDLLAALASLDGENAE